METGTIIKDLSELDFFLGKGEIHTVSIGIFDVGGPSAKKGADMRRKYVASLLDRFKPNILLLQQFPWRFSASSMFDHRQYEYCGSKEAGILYDRNNVLVLFLNVLWIKERLIEMKQKTKILPMKYNLPMSRMCMVEIMCKTMPSLKFLCVSWHGLYKGTTKTYRIDEFRNLLIFLSNIGFRLNRPIIIAGNFNISIAEASTILPNNFIIYQYDPLRKKQGEYVDFYIGSKKLPLSNMAVGDWEIEENGNDAKNIFHHDPVFATLLTKHATKPPVYSNQYLVDKTEASDTNTYP